MEYTMTPPNVPLPPIQSSVTYAGFWQRVLARLIDTIVYFAGYAVLGLIAYATGLEDRHNDPYNPISAILGLLIVASWWLYPALMESSPNQGTLGKMAVGLRVTDLNGTRISFGRATGRYFASLLSAITLGIGHLLAVFTPKKQAMHDMIASTLVLARRSVVAANVAQNVFPS